MRTSQLVEPAAPCDPGEPGRITGAAVILSGRSPRFEECLLRNVVRNLHGPHSHKEGSQRALVSFDQGSEGRAVTRSGATRQREILFILSRHAAWPARSHSDAAIARLQRSAGTRRPRYRSRPSRPLPRRMLAPSMAMPSARRMIPRRSSPVEVSGIRSSAMTASAAEGSRVDHSPNGLVTDPRGRETEQLNGDEGKRGDHCDRDDHFRCGHCRELLSFRSLRRKLGRVWITGPKILPISEQ